MPKLKTNRSAKKRIRVTKSGQAKHLGAGRSHLMTGKPHKRKRLSRRGRAVSGVELKSIHKMLPYGA
jgi:large subunit ribosomal protein L35